ncbi:MAG TPA: hypothetical protein VGX21_14950 [Methylomirabilota bacterium]|jgi:hypothetical protein|nr:hypothetical protein [Methylomirabilota bacterium]
MASAPQYFIVVRPDAPELFERLQSTADAVTEVILDRRKRDRRVIIQDVELERRRRERRAPVDPTGDTRGFFLARAYRAARETNGHNGHRTCLEIPAAARLRA